MPSLIKEISTSYASLNLPLVCTMDKGEHNFILYIEKRELYISEKEAEVNYQTCKIFRSFWCISLPAFLFEFWVEAASNRMIDTRSNKGFKAFNFHLFIVLLKNVNDDTV